jgi:acetolactate decarboxylase
MKRFYLGAVLSFSVTLIAIDALSQAPVTVYGELRAIMQRGDLSPKVSLDTMKMTSTTFGLGVAAGLKGEIIIIEGKPYVSYIKDGKVDLKQAKDLNAAMIVTSDLVMNRRTMKLDSNAEGAMRSRGIVSQVQSLKSLEELLDFLVAREKITGPVAFVIDVFSGNVSYHVIDWKDGVEHTPENHKQFAVSGKLINERMTIVGFYSQSSVGVFTPHSSKIHVHVYCPSKGIVGHIEELVLKGEVEIQLGF